MLGQLNIKERSLLWALLGLALLAVYGHYAFALTPARASALIADLGFHAHLGGHVFADTRSWLGLPNALDLLSNVPFAVFGVWGLCLMHRAQVSPAFGQLLRIFFIGLLLTTAGSMAYHWAPSDATLLWDRAGMSVAFAGVLGLAASDRISEGAGPCLVGATLLGAALALWLWHASGDVLPWSVVQFGGMGLVIAMACIKPEQSSVGLNLLALIGFYALAKVLESTDHAVFEATGRMISGHSLKHIAASLAALPILQALIRRLRLES